MPASTKSMAAALLGAAVLLHSGVGWAQNNDEVLKVRQTTMKRLGSDLEAVKAYLDGKADIAKANESAVDLVATAKKIPDLFPPGTGMEAFPGKSGAKPVVWTEWDKFTAAQHVLVEKADKLVAAAKGGDKAEISAAFLDVGKAGCGGCHTNFREKIQKD